MCEETLRGWMGRDGWARVEMARWVWWLMVGGELRGRKRIAGTFWTLFHPDQVCTLELAVCVHCVDGTAQHPDTMQPFCRNFPRHAVSRLRARSAYATLAAEFKPGDSLHGFTVKQVQQRRLEQESRS